MEAKYKVVITGVAEDRDRDELKVKLAEIFKTDTQKAEQLLGRLSRGEKIPVSKDLQLSAAKRSRFMLEDIGLVCDLESNLSLMEAKDEPVQALHICPACDHRQPKSGGEYDICEECGVVGQNYEEYLVRKQALEREKKRLESRLNHDAEQRFEQESLEDQRRDEARIRKQLEKQYGVDKWTRLRNTMFSRYGAAVVLAVAAVGVGGWVGLNSRGGTDSDTAALAGAAVSGQPDAASAPDVAQGEDGQPRAVLAVQPPPPDGDVSINLAMPPSADGSGAAVPSPGPVMGAASQGGEGMSLTASVSDTPADPAAGGVSSDIPNPAAEGGASAVPRTTASPPAVATAASRSTTRSEEPLVGAGPETTPAPSAENPAAAPDQVRPAPLALIRLAVEAAGAGQVEQAERHLSGAQVAAGRVADLPARAATLAALAAPRVEALAALGAQQARQGGLDAARERFAEAVEALAAVDDGIERVQALGGLAAGLSRGGDPGSADRFFRQAEQAVEVLASTTARVSALSRLGRQAARVGRSELARRLLERIEPLPDTLDPPAERALALAELASLQAAAGEQEDAWWHFEQAEGLLDNIQPPGLRRELAQRLALLRVEVLVDMSLALQSQGQRELAAQSAQYALQRAETLEPAWQRAVGLGGTAHAYGVLGEPDTARELLARAEELLRDGTVQAQVVE